MARGVRLRGYQVRARQ